MSTCLLIALILFAIGLVFAAVIGGWTHAIRQTEASGERGGNEAVPFISVIVPARDEEAGIAGILQDLYAQDHPRDRMEVIVVDDQSTDRTSTIVQEMIARWPRLRLLPNNGAGKKAAITTAVEAAKGELIVLTDADVRCGPRRLASIAEHWQMKQSALIVLPVWTTGSGILGGLQVDEQAALLGMAIGTSGSGSPALAYGANLAFTKAAFVAANGYEGDRSSSGDDVFLLQRIKHNGGTVTGHFDPDAAVIAQAMNGLGPMIQQRLRWAGKMHGVRGGSNLLGSMALLYPWGLLITSITCAPRIGDHALFTTSLLFAAWCMWIVPVLMLVRSVRTRFGQPASLMGTLVSMIAFTGYAPVIAMVSPFLRPLWKGRRVRTRGPHELFREI
ncbi:MAG: glycosyltransferase [Flavobacteriales bacterium]|nr:glycosyltransferase [Flavobacteriales bacterium]